MCMEKFGNNFDTYLYLWRLFRYTRQSFHGRFKIFCPRRILQEWLPEKADDDFIYEVCSVAGLDGFYQLPRPSVYPLPGREFIKSLVRVLLDLKEREVNFDDLDRAYSAVYPKSTPINLVKKGRRAWDDRQVRGKGHYCSDEGVLEYLEDLLNNKNRKARELMDKMKKH